jgi:hypothetical protein
LPYTTSPTCIVAVKARIVPSAAAAPAKSSLARSTAWKAARQAAASGLDRKDREDAVAQKLEHVAAGAVHGIDHRLEIAIECRKQIRLAETFAERGEAAQVGEQDRRFDLAAVATPDRAGENGVGGPGTEEGAQ